MSHKKPLDPLIPLEDLKKVVGGLIRVPKTDAAPKPGPKPKSTTRGAKKP